MGSCISEEERVMDEDMDENVLKWLGSTKEDKNVYKYY